MDTNRINDMIREGKTKDAIALLDKRIEEGDASDRLFYLRGKAWQKAGDFRQALNNYLSAMELNPSGDAVQAYDMLMKIMNFYHKDMYNH